MFFTNLVMHFSCISTIRNGIYMMQYAIYQSDQFHNPNIALFLGFMVTITNVLAAATNSYNTMTQNSVIKVITKFVGFKLLIQIQDYYLKSRPNFKIKDIVAREPLVMN